MTISYGITVTFVLPDEKEEYKQFAERIDDTEWHVKQTSKTIMYFRSNCVSTRSGKECY